MSYIIKTCPTCKKIYHIHSTGKVVGACDHIKISKISGKRQFIPAVDTKELDKMIDKEGCERI